MLEITIETKFVIDDTCVTVRVIAGAEDSDEEMLVEDDGATKVIVFETVIDFVMVDADSVVGLDCCHFPVVLIQRLNPLRLQPLQV